jgi:hypothetical protein
MITWLLPALLAAAPAPPVAKLVVEPSPLALRAGEARRVLVTGITKDGERVDLTSRAVLKPRSRAVAVDKDGYLSAAQPGEARVAVSAAGRSAELPVTIQPAPERVLTFLRDVAPVLNKAGCTSGPCHGAAKGKNGFKLSLRGYDPEFDYRALLYDLSGRRFNRSDPARSLMLAKPTQQVAHGGGLRFDLGSRYYNTILQWIAAGAPYGDPAKDQPQRLEVVPPEIFHQRPGLEQQILVLAHYGDGSSRDVTREAVVGSNAASTAEVDAGGVLKGLRKGEAAVLVRYEGKFVTVPVTILDPRPGFVFTALPQNNYIDEHIDAKLKRLKIQPSAAASDAEFLRRVSLDLIGLPPTPQETRAFLANPDRARAIDRLMLRPEFVDHWALKWGDLLQNSRKYVGDKGNWAFREWIRKSIAENKPYDKMVRELLTARGSTFENPAANFFRVTREPKASMEKTTQLFLGVRMVCAQCHDHPFEQWTQNNYYELAAFFAAVGVKPGLESEEEVVFERREDAVIKHPKDGRVMQPRFLIASLDPPRIPASGDARESLVEWLTSPKNPFFARAIANRVWSYFFGRGIIDPVDDIRASNPPVNEPLLDALGKDLTASGYDLQRLIRTIVSSRTYQASIATNTWNADDEVNFSRQIPRRLTAEQLLDAATLATGSRPNFPEVPPDFRAEQLPGPHVGMGGFLDVFGRPQRESSCECERRSDLSLPQTLNLLNGPALAEAIADPKGRIAGLITNGVPDRQIVEELYLAALSRLPDAKELDQAMTYLQKGPSRASRAQDLLWALLNSNAFLFNR